MDYEENKKVLEIQKLFLKAKSMEQIKYLQDMGYDLYAKDRDGKDVLSKAQTAKQTKMFLEAGEWSKKSIDSALVDAETVEQTKLLLTKKPSKSARESAFIAANSIEQTELLFDTKYPQHIKDIAMDWAEDTKQIEFLIEKGVSKDKIGSKLSDSDIKDTELVKFLLEFGISQDDLDHALQNECSYEKAKLLVDAGAHIDEYYEAFSNATTPEYMQLLLSCVDKSKKRDVFKSEAFGGVIRNAESLDLVKFCLKQGANPNRLLLAVKTAEETEYLLQNGANVNAQNKYDKENALWGANLEKTKVLLKYNIDVNHVDEYGENVLYSLHDNEMEKGRLIMKAGVKDLPNVRIIDNCQYDIRQMFIDEQERRNHIETVRKKVAKMHEEGVSGVVVADKIGDKMRSGEVEKTVTPKYARDELAPQIREEIKNRKIKHQ